MVPGIEASPDKMLQVCEGGGEGRGGEGREGKGREGSGRRGRRKGRRREGEMNANTQVAPRCVLQYVGDCVKIS